MSDALALDLANDLAEIPRLAEAVEAFFDERGLPPKLAFEFNLALDELLTNVISYAFPAGGDHRITVRVAIAGDGRVTAELEDDGAPFDPFAEAPPPVLDGDLEDRPIGGLGVHFVRTMMDAVQYERRGGRNRVTLAKSTA